MTRQAPANVSMGTANEKACQGARPLTQKNVRLQPCRWQISRRTTSSRAWLERFSTAEPCVGTNRAVRTTALGNYQSPRRAILEFTGDIAAAA